MKTLKPAKVTESIKIDKPTYQVVRRYATADGRTLVGMLRIIVSNYRTQRDGVYEK